MFAFWSLVSVVAFAGEPAAQPVVAYVVKERETLQVSAPEGLLKGESASHYIDVAAMVPVTGLELTEEGAFTYTSGGTELRTVYTTFTMRDKDDPNWLQQGRLLIEITAINDAPTAPSVAVVLDPAKKGVFSLPAVEDDNAQFGAAAPVISVVTQPPAGQGNVTLDAKKKEFNFTAGASFSGRSQFDYEVTDHAGLATRGTITVYAKYEGSPPVVKDGNVHAKEGSAPLELDLLGLTSDLDSDNNQLNVQILSTPEKGTLQRDTPRRGVWLYTPAPYQNGEVTVQFQVDDGLHLSNKGTYTVTLDPVNNAPTAPTEAIEIKPESRFLALNLSKYLVDEDKDSVHVVEGSFDGHSLPTGVTTTSQMQGDILTLDLGEPAFVGDLALNFSATDGIAQPVPMTLKVSIATQAVSVDRWCEVPPPPEIALFARAWDGANTEKTQQPPYVICLDAGRDTQRITLMYPKNQWFLPRGYPIGAPLEIRVRTGATANLPTLSVMSDDTFLTTPDPRSGAVDSHKVYIWRYAPDLPENQLRLDVTVNDSSKSDSKSADPNQRQRTIIKPVGRWIWSLNQMHILFPSISRDISLVPDDVQVVPGGLLAVSADGSQVQAIADVISGDLLVTRLAFRGIAATVGQTEGEASTVGFLSIPSDLDSAAAFRSFATGEGLYLTLPILASDWGARAYGPQVQRKGNLSAGGRLGLQPAADAMPFSELFLLAQGQWTGRNNNGEPTLTISGEGRIGMAHASPDFADQLLKPSDSGNLDRHNFYYGVLTLGLGQAGGARLGAQLYFAPEVDAKLVPSLVLNYGM